MPRLQQVGHLALRVLLCALFLFSAAAKLRAVDQFEMYIFSYGLLPLWASYLAARLCIGAELVLAALLAVGWFPRLARTLSVLMLSGFSLVLCYALLVGRSDSCHCLGAAVEMKPAASLVKNAVLLLLVLLCYRLAPPLRVPRHRRLRLWLAVAGAAALMAGPFVVSVPDNWAFGPSSEPYNQALLAQAMSPDAPLARYGLDRGTRLVAFVTPGCPYCRLARQKIDAIALRHRLPRGSVLYVEPDDMGTDLFLRITYGARPLVLLMRDGQVIRTYHYRNISEREVADALRVAD